MNLFSLVLCTIYTGQLNKQIEEQVCSIGNEVQIPFFFHKKTELDKNKICTENLNYLNINVL